MARKKPDVIPEVDAIKAGIDTDQDKYENLRDESGKIKISRSKEGLKAKENFYANKLVEEEEKLNRLKEKLLKVGVDTKSKKPDKKLSKKEKKKLKKLEYKKKRKETYEETLLKAVPNDLSEFIDGFRSGKKHKKNKDEDDEPLKGLKTKTKEKKETKEDEEKKERDEITESFKDVEKLTRENIKEIEHTMKIVDVQIKDLTSTSSRMRGRDTAISNYLQAKSTLINAKQSAAKDLLATRSKVFEIKFKKSKEQGDATNSHAEMIARVFPTILGDKNLARAITKDISGAGKNKDSKNKKDKKDKGSSREIDKMLEKREKELVDSGDISYNVYDQNIELEGTYTIAIKKSWTDGDWKFVATDNHGNFIDVPKKLLPKKSNCTMVFDDEKDLSVNKGTGETYKVYSVPTI